MSASSYFHAQIWIARAPLRTTLEHEMLLHGVLGLHVVCCVLIVGQVDPRQREGFLALEQRILISRRRRTTNI